MLANHKEFFFNLLKEHIRGTYGFPRQNEEEYQQRYRDGVLTDQEVHDHNCPGPFSFHSYLMALLSPNMWGDEQVHTDQVQEKIHTGKNRWSVSDVPGSALYPSL